MAVFRTLVLTCLFLAPTFAAAQEPLLIGTKAAPPFVVEEADGSLSGISIELWRLLADTLDLDYEFKRLSLEELLAGVQAGELDAAIAAISITAEREQRMDFTHPYHSAGLTIATRPDGGSGWLLVAQRFFSWQFASVVGALTALLFIIGALVWLFERRRNPEQFGGSPAKGIGSGFWWAAVTMTTVGYGDKAPQTLPGRLLGLVWMFTAIIIISSFTAAIATSLTVGELAQQISGVDDLAGKRVATVTASTGAQELERRHIGYQGYGDLEAALAALGDGRVDAVVYDAPVLAYFAAQGEGGKIQVLEQQFAVRDYGIALPEESPLIEPLNRALLEVIYSAQWRSLLRRYLGEPSG